MAEDRPCLATVVCVLALVHIDELRTGTTLPMPTTTGVMEEFVVRQLRRQDKVAPRYRVCHVPEMEEYLSIRWDARGKAILEVLREQHCGKVAW